ncbi:glutamine synthetase [Halovulum dunhuangense]|uniref:Glutamine synthetase n=1 Tax=Halovulum dunhuangense TaxID=1505036 RepID=A0A849L0Y9_9RHOB|nr:glutamine synthetase family protein [Halovulum dunhuangense]NNU79942.1 glutamine synthetase [Halovulum dunhuangense]
MAAPLSLQELTAAVEAGEIDTVIMAQVDMQGRLMGKRFHASHFLESGVHETHSCNYLLTVDMEMEPVPGFKSASWATGYGDYMMKPDLSTLRRIPWQEGAALVICDIMDHHGHDDIAVSPRAILKRQLARAHAMGFQPMMASELEFYLFEDSYAQAHSKGYRGLTPVSTYNEDYHLFQTTKEEGVMRAIRNGLFGAGIPVENSKGEAWAGQEEINVKYADALSAADNHVITKTGVKEIAWAHGQAATFMAKYDFRAAGSSSHIHQSLWSTDGRIPLFLDPDGEYGMSETMRHYVAGLLAHASEVTAFLAPNINSYKRFQAGTFAPTKAVWSRDNRTAGYRLVGEGTKAIRIENRVGGADLNPYLAFAAQIAAGLAGIEQKLALEPEFSGDAYSARRVREIPKTLREATVALKRSGMLRAAMGDDVVDHYVHAAEWEQFEYDRRVTDWEIARGFERS